MKNQVKQTPPPESDLTPKPQAETIKPNESDESGFKASENIISNCLISLEQFTAATQKILHNDKVVQWQNVPAHKCTSLSKQLHLPQDLNICRRQYPQIAVKIEAMVQQWQNEIGNLTTDLEHSPITPETAFKRAKEIEQGCAAIEPLTKAMAGHEKVLVKVDISIRNMLNMQGLLTFAKSASGQKSSGLDEAFQIYRLMTDNIHEKGGQKSIADYTEEILDIEKRLAYIEAKGLPEMAIEVINHNIQDVLAASKNVRKYLDHATHRLADEYNYICKIQKGLMSIKENPIVEIIKILDKVTDKLTASLMRLFFKANVLNELKNIPDIIEDLHIVHLAVKRDFIEKFTATIHQENSSINPATVSVELTDNFFSGMSGMVRIFRLFYVSMKGSPGVTEEALQQQLESFLNSCSTIYGNKPADVEKVSAAISSYLSDYEKPFPFEILFRVFKKAMGVYTGRLESYFNGFRIENVEFLRPETQSDAKSSHAIPSTLGKLIVVIKTKAQLMLTEMQG